MSAATRAETIILYAAGSLAAALTDISRAYATATGDRVEATFAASGTLRERIEKGERAHVFASADMKHPQTLQTAGKGGPVSLFTRNKLCAIAQPELDVSSDTLLDRLLDPKLRVGTSTPEADPSGDYAWQLFRKADMVQAGAYDMLDKKALKLTGAPDGVKAPEGKNQYAWLMGSEQADLFLTYCTNAVLAKKEMPGLKIVAIPMQFAVGADYGLIVLKDAPASGERFARFILSPEGQEVLGRYGFDAK